MEMLTDHTPLRSYLNSIAILSEPEWQSLNEILYLKEYEKKELIQQAGKKCKIVGFILQGC